MRYLLWGTGKEAQKLLECQSEFKGELIGFVETVCKDHYFNDKPVIALQNIKKIEYDLIIVTPILYADEIYNDALENGISSDKLCFFHLPQKQHLDMNDNLRKLSEVLPERILIDMEGYKGNKRFDFILKDLELYNSMNTREAFQYKEEYKDFWYYDKYAEAGSITNYFWQDLWAAQLVYRNRVKMHYDIGSRIDGFISHLLSFGQKVTLIDVRSLDRYIEGIHFIHTDATELKGIENDSIESISALCSLEHFGLGRYGDSVDPEACFKAFESICKKVKKGGHVFISVPIGQDHLEFNGCRIFRAQTIVDAFKGMELVEFSVTHHGKIEYNVPIQSWDHFSEKHAVCYGLFHFQKY